MSTGTWDLSICGAGNQVSDTGSVEPLVYMSKGLKIPYTPVTYALLSCSMQEVSKSNLFVNIGMCYQSI